MDVYTLATNEGIQLVHSLFRDFSITLTSVLVIIGGGILGSEPLLLLILPLFLGVYGLYAIGKFRTISILGAFLIYVEREMNQTLSAPIAFWNTFFARRRLAPAWGSHWGQMALSIAVAFCVVLYVGITWWVYIQNRATFASNPLLTAVCVALTAALLLGNIAAVAEALIVVRKHTFDKIERLLDETTIAEKD